MSYIRKLNTQIIFLIVISASALLMAACSAPAEKLNQDGNQAFAEQAYLEALDLYQSAQVESPELAEPYFNAANSFYRQGDYPAALEQMQMALQYVDEEALAESSLFNLGNTLYNSQELNKAVDAYTQALLLDPEDQDAKYNLELALQQQEQQQEQNQDQQESESENEENQSQDQSGEDQESENDQEGDQSQEQGNQDQENQNNEGEQSENQDPQDEDQQGDGSGQPQEGEDSPEGEQPGQMPPPGQRMTEEQARQLLAAIASNMETLQEHLGQYLFARQAPPLQDW